MDYVVYGTGYGATLMLLGYALRTWGPNWRFREEDERAFARGELRSARSAWTRFTGGLGAVIATCGVVLILFTFALMLANPGDSVSEMVSLVLSGLLLLAVAVWAWMYVDRFGGFGVVRAPAALTGQTTEPLRYDNRPQQAETVSTAAADAAADEDDDQADEVGEPDVVEDEDDETEFGIDEDEAAELRARYSKFETHHPDGSGDDGESVPREAPAGDADVQGAPEPGSEDVEARSIKFETHHPETGDDPEAVDDQIADDVEPKVEEVPEADDAVADGMVEDVSTVDAVVVEQDAVAEETVVVTAVGEEEVPADQDVEPEPEVADDAEPPAQTATEPEEDRGGRDDALRRLRERKANRARQADDA